MTFVWPWLLLLLPLPYLLDRYLPAGRHEAALLLPAAELLPALSEARTAASRPHRVAAVGLAIWALLVLAAARPIGIAPSSGMSVSGRELMLAIDVSGSMGIRDLRLEGRAVSRLEAARELALRFLTHRDGDRIGLVVFGRRAYVHTPLTFDLAALGRGLSDVDIGLAGKETALGDAVALGASRQTEFSGSERVLVLLTDGANTAGELDPVQAGWLAQRAGVRLHIVGIGTPRSAGPDSPSSTEDELDEKTLRELARVTGGSYARAVDSKELEAFFAAIHALEPVDHLHAAVRPARELYPWPLALAICLSAVALAMAYGRRGAGERA